jgi:hypothetical protein
MAMPRNPRRLFRAIVVGGVALPVAALTIPATLALSACDDDGDDDGTTKPDTGFGYIWDGAFPPDAEPDASSDAGPTDGAAPKSALRGA